jgi:outer membrane protein assembly factor BamB
VHQVQAINPTTGRVAWTGTIGLHHWSSPILANGILYMVDGNSGGFGSGASGDLIAWSLGCAEHTAGGLLRDRVLDLGGVTDIAASGR